MAADFQPPYFPPPFPGQHQTAQEVFAAAQGSHLAAAAAADPYNVTNSLHNFQSSQVRTRCALFHHSPSHFISLSSPHSSLSSDCFHNFPALGSVPILLWRSFLISLALASSIFPQPANDHFGKSSTTYFADREED